MRRTWQRERRSRRVGPGCEIEEGPAEYQNCGGGGRGPTLYFIPSYLPNIGTFTSIPASSKAWQDLLERGEMESQMHHPSFKEKNRFYHFWGLIRLRFEVLS